MLSALATLAAASGVAYAIWALLAGAFLLALLLHCGVTATWIPSTLRSVCQDAIRYGKTKSYGGRPRPAWLRHCDLPKRWFSHFYFIAVVWNGFLLLVLLQTLFIGKSVPIWLTAVLKVLKGTSNKQIADGQLSGFLVLLLLWLHSARRLEECLFVSVFSNGVIHLIQYCFGLCYYVLLGLTVLCQVPLNDRNATLEDLLDQTKWHHLLGIMIYIWASVHQHRCHVILANLRKNQSGNVVSFGHSVPHGDWFERVSCPHYFSELLIYIAMGVVFGPENLNWCLVVAYVLFSQALEAVLCHEFYLQKFDSYPTHRKAFIPFVF